MREELVDLPIALDAGVAASVHAEKWTKGTQNTINHISSDGYLDIKRRSVRFLDPAKAS